MERISNAPSPSPPAEFPEMGQQPQEARGRRFEFSKLKEKLYTYPIIDLRGREGEKTKTKTKNAPKIKIPKCEEEEIRRGVPLQARQRKRKQLEQQIGEHRKLEQELELGSPWLPHFGRPTKPLPPS